MKPPGMGLRTKGLEFVTLKSEVSSLFYFFKIIVVIRTTVVLGTGLSPVYKLHAFL